MNTTKSASIRFDPVDGFWYIRQMINGNMRMDSRHSTIDGALKRIKEIME